MQEPPQNIQDIKTPHQLKCILEEVGDYVLSSCANTLFLNDVHGPCLSLCSQDDFMELGFSFGQRKMLSHFIENVSALTRMVLKRESSAKPEESKTENVYEEIGGEKNESAKS